MKKLILCAACILGTLWAQAQIAEVSTPRPLLKGVQSNIYNPVLSADGTKLIFTQSDYSDLRVYDFTDNVTKKINADRRQGFNARFDGTEVTFKPTAVRCDGAKVIITVNGKERSFSPVQCDAGYCWASLSPDGKKVVFLAAGKGLVVMDLNGNILSQPGNYEAPVWFGNDHLVVQNATDDGHQLHSSQILLLTADGSQVQALTKPESMSLSPAASIQANRVVYSTIDGRLYEMEVILK